MDTNIKLCECGCGQPAPIATHTIKISGCIKYIKGQPKKFIRGHHMKGRKFSVQTKQKMSEATKGKKCLKSTREKLSKAHKGKKLSKEHCYKLSIVRLGEKHHMFGKQMSESTRFKMSKAAKGRIFSIEHRQNLSKAAKGPKMGCNNPGWRGGISFEPYCIEFTKELKDFIKNRDDNKCKNPDCWNKTSRLCIHHIDYDKKRCDFDNLITLCLSCNSRANKNRDIWQEKYEQINAQIR